MPTESASYLINGKYEVTAELPPKKGGMGIVFIGRRLTDGASVAIKFMSPAFLRRLGPEDRVRQIERFHREAQTLSQLKHPNVVEYFDHGADGGAPYLIMRYVEGPSIAERFPELRRDRKKAIKLCRDAALALQYVHDQGVIHRDLKPQHIIIDPDGSACLIDFGICQPTGSQDSTQTLTQWGECLATIVYAAPEQLRGERVDGKADIYSLGAILYELLAGLAPFRGDTDNEIVMGKRQVPCPPSTFRRDVDTELERICLRCLQPDPAKRFKSMNELADELTRWLEKKPIYTKPERKLSSLGRAVACCGVLAIVPAIGFGFYGIHKRMDDEHTGRQEQQQQLEQERTKVLQLEIHNSDLQRRLTEQEKSDLYEEVFGAEEPSSEEEVAASVELEKNPPRAGSKAVDWNLWLRDFSNSLCSKIRKLNVEIANDELDELTRRFDLVKEHVPDSACAFTCLARVYDNMAIFLPNSPSAAEHRRMAEAYYRKALASDPAWRRAANNLAELLGREERFKEAAELATQALLLAMLQRDRQQTRMKAGGPAKKRVSLRSTLDTSLQIHVKWARRAQLQPGNSPSAEELMATSAALCKRLVDSLKQDLEEDRRIPGYSEFATTLEKRLKASTKAQGMLVVGKLPSEAEMDEVGGVK